MARGGLARPILLAAAIVWIVAAAAALGVAVVGIDRLLAVLPPLAIDADALRGAIVALGVGAALGGAAHAVLVALLHAQEIGRRRLASTITLLMSSVLVAAFLALAAAAAASAVARPELGIGLWAGCVAGLVAAVAYAAVVAALVGERRSNPPGRPA